MSDSGRAMGECKHGHLSEWCVQCLRAEVSRLQDEVADEREWAYGKVYQLQHEFDTKLELAKLEISRLKQGDWTLQEFRDLCNSFDRQGKTLRVS